MSAALLLVKIIRFHFSIRKGMIIVNKLRERGGGGGEREEGRKEGKERK